MLGARPSREVGSAFADQLERQRRTHPVDLGKIDPQQRVERHPDVEGRRVRLLCRMPGRRQLAHWLVTRRGQPIEDRLEANIAVDNLGLVDVIQLQGLGQGEPVLLAVVAGQRGAERLPRRVAARIAVGCQNGGIAFPGDDGTDDAHPRRARDIGHDMVELQVPLRQRLLPVLDVGRGVFQQPFTLAQIGPQDRDLPLRLETAAQQAVGVQSLEPLGIADLRPGTCLASRALTSSTSNPR